MRKSILHVAGWAWLLSAACLAEAAGPALRLMSVEPTVFFVQREGTLLQVAEVTVENLSAAVDARLEIRRSTSKTLAALGRLNRGRSTVQVHLPEVREATPIEFVVAADGAQQDRRTVTWRPQRHWEVCFVPVTHHDLGYTDTIENVLRNYDGFYDDILRFCDETEQWPAESRYRYTVEGSWSVLHFLDNRPRQAAQRLAKYVRQGRIEIPALLGNPVGALCSHEELIRLAYPSFRLKRELGAPIRTAAVTDVPGLSWGLPTMLAGAGVEYLFAGLPTYFQWGTLHVHDFWNEAAILPHGRPDAFRWEGPDGRSLLVYYQGGYGHFTAGTGPHTYEDVLKHLPGKLAAIQRQGSPLSVVRYIHNGVDNFPPDVEISRIVRQWNERWAYPKLIVATNFMFFEQLAKQCRGARTFRGELPDTDYVVGAAATPLETGINRVTHDRLHAAEKFATVASLLADFPRPPDKKFWITAHSHYADVTQTLGEAYQNALLFDEHTWGMAHQAGAQQDWDWSDKSRYAYKAAGLADSILGGSLDAIADRITLDTPGRHLVVFNSLSVARTDVVRVSAKRAGYGQFLLFPEKPFALVDEETGKEVPWQIVKLASPRAPVPYAAERYARGQFNPPELYELVFVAEGVPPLGWKTYRMVPRQQAMPSHSRLAVGDNSLENGLFKITVDRQTGAIASVFDKELAREIVDRDSPHKLNQLVARQVSDGRLETPTQVTIEKGATGPVYGSLVISTAVAGCPQVTQEVVLYDRIKRIDLSNRILKDSTPQEELYFAFPFKIDKPDFRFEGPLSVIKPLGDQFPGSNSNYYAVQHWADASDGRVGVTLSAVESHLLEFGGLWPCYVSQAHHGVTPPDFGRPFVRPEDQTKGHLYAFVLDGNFRTNFPPLRQGDMLFRYALTTHKGTWKEGTPRDFGWGIGNPLVAVSVDGKREGTLEKTMTFCRVEPANAFLLTLKRAEDGDGLVVRLIETAGQAATATLAIPHATVQRAWATNLVEENQTQLAFTAHQVTTPITAFGVATIRVRVQPTTR